LIKKYLDERWIFNRKVYKSKKPKDKPFGPCVFLDDKECTIHDAKPLNCLLGSGCHEHGQELSIWFMLNYVIDPSDPQAIREWNEYLKIAPTIPGGKLDELVKSKKLLDKILDYRILMPQDIGAEDKNARRKN